MAIGIQDAKEKGIEWVNAEYQRLLEDLDRDANYFNVIKIAKEQLEAEVNKAEVMDSAFKLFVGGQDITEGMAEEQREFIALLYDEIAARVSIPLKAEISDQEVIIRTLKETIDEKNAIIEDQKKDIQHYTEIEGKLNTEISDLHEEIDRHIKEKGELIQEIEQHKLDKEDLEQKRDNAVRAIEELRIEKDEEIRKLQDRICELETAQEAEAVEKRAAAVLESNERTERLQELAKKFVLGERVGLYQEVIGQDGNKEFVHHSEVAKLEAEGAIVTEFPDLPEIEGVSEQKSCGTEPDVEEATVVLEGIEDTVDSDTDQEGETTGAETTETAQETQDREEVGETWKREVTRRLGDLEMAIFGHINDREAA